MYKFFIKFHDDPTGSIDIEIEGNKTVQDLETAIIQKKRFSTDSKITFIYRAQLFTKDDGFIQSVPALSSVSQNIKITIHAVVIQPRNNPELIANNTLFMDTENNNRNLFAELCEFCFGPGLALLTNVGLAARQNPKIITGFFLFTFVGGLIGTGFDCWLYGKSFYYNFNYGKINNLCAIVSITLYLSFIAYRKKRNLGKIGLLSLLPLVGYFIGSALSANSLQPLKMWHCSGGDQTSLIAACIGLLVIIVFGVKNIDSENIVVEEQEDGLQMGIDNN